MVNVEWCHDCNEPECRKPQHECEHWQRRHKPVHELGGRREMMIFFRKEGWYPIQGVKDIPLVRQALDHASRNPGTLKVEDIDGVLLWSLQ